MDSMKWNTHTHTHTSWRTPQVVPQVVHLVVRSNELPFTGREQQVHHQKGLVLGRIRPGTVSMGRPEDTETEKTEETLPISEV